MRRTSLALIGTTFTLALLFGDSAPRAEQSGDAQQGQQGQQGGQQAQQGAPKPSTPSISLRKFVFTLVMGDMLSSVGSTFTPASSKALADLKDFLPYKRYTLLDTIFKIGLGGPSVQVKGPDDTQKYELWTTGQGHPDGKRVSVRLQLKTLPAQERPMTILIDTGFEIDMGETVVVGTSRLDGNRALLLLVTSVP